MKLTCSPSLQLIMLNTEVIFGPLQNVDPFDKPWLKLAAKAPIKPAAPKGRVTSARIRGC